MGYRGVPNISKRILGLRLRKMRIERDMSLMELADRLGMSRSAVDRRENGYTAVSVDDVNAYSELFGVTDSEHHKILEELARRCNQRGWWYKYAKCVDQAHLDMVDAEDMATEIYFVRSAGFPALLETEDYARAELSIGRRNLEAQGLSINKSIELRMHRKKILEKDSPPEIFAILAEGCLRTVVGDVNVMAQQVKHLLEIRERSNIHLKVMPFGMGYPFSADRRIIMKFKPLFGSAMVLDVGGEFEESPEMSEMRLSQFWNDWERSPSEEESRRYMHDLLSAMTE